MTKKHLEKCVEAESLIESVPLSEEFCLVVHTSNTICIRDPVVEETTVINIPEEYTFLSPFFSHKAYKNKEKKPKTEGVPWSLRFWRKGPYMEMLG